MSSKIMSDGDFEDLLDNIIGMLEAIGLGDVNPDQARSTLKKVVAGAQHFDDYGFVEWYRTLDESIDVSVPSKSPGELVFRKYDHTMLVVLRNMRFDTAVSLGFIPFDIASRKEIKLLNFCWNSTASYLREIYRMAV